MLDPELMALVPACADLQRPFDEVRAEYIKRQLVIPFGVVARTKFIDQSLQASLAESVRQVVILGAGLDSRAYRIGPQHEDVRFFEVNARGAQASRGFRGGTQRPEAPLDQGNPGLAGSVSWSRPTGKPIETNARLATKPPPTVGRW